MFLKKKKRKENDKFDYLEGTLVPTISEWNEVFFSGRNYEVYYFPKVKIKRSSESYLISLFMKKKKIEEL